MQLDRVTLEHVRDVARAEGRTQAEALRQLVGEAVSARRHNGTAVVAPAPQVDDASNMRGSIVTAFVPGRVRYALAELATKEGRSISSTVKLLLKESLMQRGELRALGNDPR